MSSSPYTGPAGVVQSMHGVPRFTGTNTFDVTTDYFLGVGLIIVPWAVVGAFFFLLSLIVFCCACCRCCRRFTNDRVDGPPQTNICTRLTIILMILLVLGGLGLAIAGCVYVVESMDDAKTTVLEVIVGGINDGLVITSNTTDIIDAAQTTLSGYETACGSNPVTDQLHNELASVASDIQSVTSLLQDGQDQVDNYRSYVDTAQLVISIVCFILVGIGFVGIFFYIFALCTSFCGPCYPVYFCARGMLIFFGLITLFIIWTNVGIAMAGNVLAADYCMDPDGNTILIANDIASSQSNITGYYVTCQGENPFQSDIDSLNSALTQAQNELNALKANSNLCPAGSPYVDELQGELDQAGVERDQLVVLVSCPTFNQPYQQVAYNDICGAGGTQKSFFNGSLFIWIGSLVASVFFTILMLCFDRINGRRQSGSKVED